MNLDQFSPFHTQSPANMAMFAFLLLFILSATALASDGGPLPEIDPSLLQEPSSDPQNIFITMRAGTEGVLAANSRAPFATRGARRSAVHAALQEHARATQAPLLEALETLDPQISSQIKSFWITNQIYIRNVTPSVLELLSQRVDVSHIAPELHITLDPLIDLEVGTGNPDDELAPVPFDVEYNLEIIRLPEVWAADVNGTGVVVANIDTGVRHTHQALRDGYKDDDYSWFNPVTGSPTPVDDHTHGTMTMGLLAGGLEVGVAFGAKWIACKAFNSQGTAAQSHLLECGQFILCPTHPDGQEPDCDQAPHVVSNSWNSVDPFATFFFPVIEAWEAGGIVPVWSAGNYGLDGCSSLGSQAPFPQVIAVGSTNAMDQHSVWSSKGPNRLDRDILKPNLGAPGEDVRSAHSQSDTTYARTSGTSMAAPHVAGVIALILGMEPELGFGEVKQILESTAGRDLASIDAECGGRPDSEFPNFHFGHGRLDALAVYECVADGKSCLQMPTEPPTTKEPPTTEPSTTEPPPVTTTATASTTPSTIGPNPTDPSTEARTEDPGESTTPSKASTGPGTLSWILAAGVFAHLLNLN